MIDTIGTNKSAYSRANIHDGGIKLEVFVRTLKKKAVQPTILYKNIMNINKLKLIISTLVNIRQAY